MEAAPVGCGIEAGRAGQAEWIDLAARVAWTEDGLHP